MSYFPTVWLELLHDILWNGEEVAPRGQPTRELLQRTIAIDMRRPVLTVPNRDLSYKFMAAEAYWILTGDDRVETIAPYNKRIAEFSDDGIRFFGAYGPKVKDQLPYVVDALRRDASSRQAGLTIWRENPPRTKDVPCTVALFFNIRRGLLNVNAFMRSNDVWLGTPYDVFNFSMLGHLVCARLNQYPVLRSPSAPAPAPIIRPGRLYLTAASSHLYQQNWDAADRCIIGGAVYSARTPEELYLNEVKLIDTLQGLRHTAPGEPLRWWEAKDRL